MKSVYQDLFLGAYVEHVNLMVIVTNRYQFLLFSSTKCERHIFKILKAQPEKRLSCVLRREEVFQIPSQVNTFHNYAFLFTENCLDIGVHFMHTMRNLVFEKRNCNLEQDSEGNLVLTFLDSNGNELEKQIASLLDKRMATGKNKVQWWGNRGIKLRFENQYSPAKTQGSLP